MSIDLGGGNNTLTLAAGGNMGTVNNIGTVIGGSGADIITLGTAIAKGSIDLGVGNDTLTFGNGTNSATVANTETITGGTGSDSVTLSGALTTAMSVDLGGGSNTLTLANGGNTGTVNNVQTLAGGSGADAITLATAMINGSVDLGAGNDTLQLAAFTNHVSIANTETVFGGSGNDTIVLTGSNASMVMGGAGMNFITGNTGADEFVFDQDGAGNNSTVLNFSAAKGDKIGLDTTGSSTLTTNTYDLGGAALTNGTNLEAVADAATRLTVSEATGGKGGFVYEQDTGELYYSSSGSFSGGGTLVGVIDSSSGTPWVYSASSFTQV
jgi:Ca2+-binding RTX toxin-like protein